MNGLIDEATLTLRLKYDNACKIYEKLDIGKEFELKIEGLDLHGKLRVNSMEVSNLGYAAAVKMKILAGMIWPEIKIQNQHEQNDESSKGTDKQG